jgi:hypothetical protein
VDSSWDSSVRGFADAATWFARTVSAVDGRWDRPGLGEWDVRSLAGHTSRALLTVEAYLARPASSAALASPVAYFSAARELAAGPDVAARGREAGEALGPDPVAAVADIVARVVPLVSSCSGEELVTTIVGGMRLGDYLPTRTFELVAHTTDLAWALGLPPDVPPLPALQALELVSALAVDSGAAGPLLLAALGRSGLPEGFSVL